MPRAVKPSSASSGLALSRYVMILILFILLGLIALFTERKLFLGSKEARENVHLHDHHFGYSALEDKVTTRSAELVHHHDVNINDKVKHDVAAAEQHHQEQNHLEQHHQQKQHKDAEEETDVAVDASHHACRIYGDKNLPLDQHLFITDIQDDDEHHFSSEKEREIAVDVTTQFKDKVTLFVNVASKCGYTNSGYKALQQLHKIYVEDGASTFKKKFEIVAIPSNDFAKQEPGSIDEIRHFAKNRFGAKFRIYKKEHVSSDQQNTLPLFKKLTRCAPEHQDQPVSWNFNFFLVDSNGRVAARFKPGTPAQVMEAMIDPLMNG